MQDPEGAERLTGFCGLYCGACDIRHAYERARAESRSATWAELPEPMQKHLPGKLKQQPIACHGCRSDTVFAGCAYCPVRSCALKHGVETCAQCESYPCIRYKLFRIVSWLVSLDKKLPHQKVRLVNLSRLKGVGTSAWRAEQQRQWTCPDCATPFSWYAKACGNCGREVESLKDYAKLT
jgi:hypothetical protein